MRCAKCGTTKEPLVCSEWKIEDEKGDIIKKVMEILCEDCMIKDLGMDKKEEEKK